ncbi:MAG: cupin domain-containing protein [Cyanobacteriota bacterium]
MSSTAQDLYSKSIDLKNLLRYQPHSIVSRELVKNKSGSITMFAFDMNQGLSEHTAPFDAYLQVLEGKAEVTINSEPKEVNTGEFIIMPANIPHSVRAIRPFKMLLVMIKEIQTI